MKCARCGVDAPELQKFCGGCGYRIGLGEVDTPVLDRSYTPAHLAQQILQSRSAIEGERKLVTVMFCDIADSTPLAARIGAERMHKVLNTFFEAALAEVHRVESTINQFLGDGFMALFGAHPSPTRTMHAEPRWLLLASGMPFRQMGYSKLQTSR
jgi:class 3 adenylate cyclase